MGAHKVWSGSKLLANFLDENPSLIENKCTIELGAGTALPSLVCLYRQSQLSIITDYPEESVLTALRETVGWNWNGIINLLHNQEGTHPSEKQARRRVGVIGHEWGVNVDQVRKLGYQLISKTYGNDINDNYFQAGEFLENTKSMEHGEDIESANLLCKEGQEDKHQNQQQPDSFYYDVAILSECLWMHRTHHDLAKSIHELLHPKHGIAIVTYAHHIPGCEEMDDAFFQICFDKYQMKTEHLMT